MINGEVEEKGDINIRSVWALFFFHLLVCLGELFGPRRTLPCVYSGVFVCVWACTHNGTYQRLSLRSHQDAFCSLKSLCVANDYFLILLAHCLCQYVCVWERRQRKTQEEMHVLMHALCMHKRVHLCDCVFTALYQGEFPYAVLLCLGALNKW